MDFYDSTDAKKYARNKTRIIKEINDIEETIAEVVDSNEFSCDVYDTVMTSTQEFVEPTKEAQAHCVMQLDTVRLHNKYNDLGVSLKEIDGQYAIQMPPIDEVDGGDADDEYSDVYANAGNAEGITKKQNYFRVGETLVVQDRNDINPLEFKIKQVDNNGDIVDLEIVSRGEFTDEIFDRANLVYKDMEKWLNFETDYGQISDLRIDRDGNVCVKDLSDMVCDEMVLSTWQPIGKTYLLGTLPPNYFGELGDIFIENGDNIFIRTTKGWLKRNKIYNYQGFRLPINYGVEGTVCYNVFGKSYVKTKCGWDEVKHVHHLGDAYRPDVHHFHIGDIVIYNQIIRNKRGEIVDRKHHTIYKCCQNCWKDIVVEHDWHNVPANDFGNDLDLFVWGDNEYRVKIAGQWLVVRDIHRFDLMYLDNTFGEIHDVISYTGEYEPYSTYVKIKPSKHYPYGRWVKVEKVWDLNEYLLGRLPVDVDLTWTIKNIILDKKGDGYIAQPTVIFSNGNATAHCKTLNDKVIDVQLSFGGDDYTDTIPEISFVMIEPSLSRKYYQVWKRMVENFVLQDEMDKVIEYFESKKYTISRVTSEGGQTFHWHLSWN